MTRRDLLFKEFVLASTPRSEGECPVVREARSMRRKLLGHNSLPHEGDRDITWSNMSEHEAERVNWKWGETISPQIPSSKVTPPKGSKNPHYCHQLGKQLFKHLSLRRDLAPSDNTHPATSKSLTRKPAVKCLAQPAATSSLVLPLLSM